MNPWIILIIAGLFEIFWPISVELSDGFSKIVPTVIGITFYIVSLILLAFALKELPVGIAYAAWTAIGVAGVAIVGMLFLGETTSILKLFFISLIIISVVGLKLVS